ncbi:hypothetical protein BOTCAL_0301g00130 [Botryotinia calthae]|uniref:Helicase ATP-binding domain-containing protein n=1 Tax=Botryotinia calthae TaxID=38488 RepID=A0A4Y8CUG1_9HELO|nr:hypothetical protein BOTCAL_0301g00130 [Botryotinia calthae]
MLVRFLRCKRNGFTITPEDDQDGDGAASAAEGYGLVIDFGNFPKIDGDHVAAFPEDDEERSMSNELDVDDDRMAILNQIAANEDRELEEEENGGVVKSSQIEKAHSALMQIRRTLEEACAALNVQDPRHPHIDDNMGLGKTLQALSVLAVIRNRLEIEDQPWIDKPTLIVVPSILLKQWEVEIGKALPDFGVIIYQPGKNFTKLERFKLESMPCNDILLTSPTTLMNNHDDKSVDNWVDGEQRLRHVKPGAEAASSNTCPYNLDKLFGMMVIDETHRYKNIHTVGWKTLHGLYANFRLLLTGTPINNEVSDIQGILALLEPTNI